MRALDPNQRYIESAVARRYGRYCTHSFCDPLLFACVNSQWWMCLAYVICSVTRGGPNVIPRADLVQELHSEVMSLRAQASLNHMDAELHAAHVRNGR